MKGFIAWCSRRSPTAEPAPAASRCTSRSRATRSSAASARRRCSMRSPRSMLAPGGRRRADALRVATATRARPPAGSAARTRGTLERRRRQRRRYAGRLIRGLLALKEAIAAASTTTLAVPHSTIGIGPIRGGVSLNIVPDTCTLELEARTLPGRDPAGVVEQIGELAPRSSGRCARAPEASIVLDRGPPTPGSPRPARRRPRDRRGGRRRGRADLARLRHRGRALPAAPRHPRRRLRPGDMAYAHRADESIGVDEAARRPGVRRAVLA